MKNKIIEILTEIRPEFNFNIESKDFFSKGILDSFDIISIVSDLEDIFGLEISRVLI